ncbi:dihydropteroate synthase, partial [Acinetobacter baumannii]
REACRAGAGIVNDVNALRSPGAVEVVRDAGAAAILMHMQGEPRTMQERPHYENVVAEVRRFLQDRVAAMDEAGVPRQRLLID